MQIQRVNRTDAEKVYLVVKNVSGATMTTGTGACILGGVVGDIVSSPDGSQAILGTAARNSTFAGVSISDIADNDYGRIQAWGYCASVLLSQEADKTIGPSTIEPGVAGAFTSTLTGHYKYAVALTTTNISGGLKYTSAFIRAL